MKRLFLNIKENLITIFFVFIIYLLNWVIPEHVRIHFYENLRQLDLTGSTDAILLTIFISIILLIVAIIGWHGINFATENGIPKLEIATANFTKTLVVVASLSAVLGTIGSSGGEIASAFFEGLRILPNIISGEPVDSAGIFSVYVANFSGVVNASAAAFAGIALLFLLATKKITIKQFSDRVKETGSKSTLILAIGLLFLYFIQSSVTWDGSPTFLQSLLVVIIGCIVFAIGFNSYKENDKTAKSKTGKDYLVETNHDYGVSLKGIGNYLATQSIGNSQNIFILVPKFMISLSALISMLIIPIEFTLVMLGFDEVYLAFAVAFITSIVEILLVIAAGELAVFLLLGSNVIDVIFGLSFGEVIPQMFGNISYHSSMPAVSMYSAIFALFTLVGVLISYYFLSIKKSVIATISFILFILTGGIIYNTAIFFNGIDFMNEFIFNNLSRYENTIFNLSWVVLIAYLLIGYNNKQKKNNVVFTEVLNSMTRLKDYYGGATFVVQLDALSLKNHLSRVSYIIKYLIDAEKYLGGDGRITLVVEDNLIPNALTKDNYSYVLSNLSHNKINYSETILQDTITKLLDKKFVADLSLANTKTPILFLSLQSNLNNNDIKKAIDIVKSKKQINNIIAEIGCFDENTETIKLLSEFNQTQTNNLTNTNWVSTANVSYNSHMEEVLKSIFDRFSDYLKELKKID